ncbi:hypothetical protein JCM8097_004919 [Rhodosporidiobolus ruineniae]
MVYTLVCHMLVKPEFVQDAIAHLKESTEVYSKDIGTIHWLTMQDVHDPCKFTIVERFEQESSQEHHLANPFWATWNPKVEPWLVKPIEVLRHEELA